MSETYNIWLAVSSQARTEFKKVRASLVDDADPYTGPMDEKTFKILNRIHGLEHMERMFKTDTVNGKQYSIYSIYTPPDAKPSTVKNALDYLEEQWPAHFIVAGAWHWDGRQAGTDWELDADGAPTGGTTGDPIYPIPAVQLLKLMPDIVTPGDDPENDPPVTTPATELTDVILLAGQKPRRFN